jgi:hypothetical protein
LSQIGLICHIPGGYATIHRKTGGRGGAIYRRIKSYGIKRLKMSSYSSQVRTPEFGVTP